MADKLRKTFPLVITFSDAEQPSGAKLSAVATQARNGLAIIEKAIGDLWNQSADTVVSSFPLQLPNLSRMLGESKYLNPVIFPSVNDFYFIEDMQDNWQGVGNGYLRFKPKNSTDIVCVDTVTGGLFSKQDNPYDLGGYYEYSVDLETGRFTFYKPIGPMTIGSNIYPRIKYLVSPNQDWLPGNEVLPGVIPDPRQTGFVGCRVSESAGSYYLHLPPRTALTLASDETPTNWPTGNQVSDNQAATLDTADRRLWQDPTVNAFDDAHYRYAFPKEIQDRLSSISVGGLLPQGFMYLWDQGNETIVEDVIFRKASFGKDWIVEIESSTLDLSTLVSSDESISSYNSGYSLIVCGAPLSRWLWAATSAFLQHQHDNSGDFSTQIQHKDLLSLNPPPGGFVSPHAARYPLGSQNVWDESSRWLGDDHASLLSRVGSQEEALYTRDTNNNAMLGHLVLSSQSQTSSGLWLDATCANADSYGIHFGDIGGPSIYATSAIASDPIELRFINSLISIERPAYSTGAALTVSGLYIDGVTPGGGSGTGIYVQSREQKSGAYAVIAEGANSVDQTAHPGSAIYAKGGDTNLSSVGLMGRGLVAVGGSTASGYEDAHAIQATATHGYAMELTGSDDPFPRKALMHLEPQNADPTDPQKGDLYVDSSGVLQIYNGAAWVAVGSQS